MTKRYILRKLVALVAPDGMPFEEYCIRCATNGVDVSLDSRPYTDWLLRGLVTEESRSAISYDAFEKVQHYLLKAIELGYIFDPKDSHDNEFMQSLATDAILIDKDLAEKLFKLMLIKYRDSAAGDAIYHLNKAFGLTSIRYFRDSLEPIKLTDMLG